MKSVEQLLILDIDEVLVYSTADSSVETFDFRVFFYRVTKRPCVDEFITKVFDWFDVAIWSSASEDYIQAMVSQLFPNPLLLKFIWGRKRCTTRTDSISREYYWVKDLKKVKRHGYDLSKILFIEDEPRKVERNYGNLITLTSFVGNPQDRELRDVLPYLAWIRTVENVRAVEKRHWRSFAKSEPR